MIHISFSMTTQQVRDRDKDITRRLGWQWLVEACARGERPILQPIVKGQGLKKGEHVELIGGPIRVLNARREALNALTGGTYTARMAKREVIREGFPKWSARQFVSFFCASHRCLPDTIVTRIEFEYLEV